MHEGDMLSVRVNQTKVLSIEEIRIVHERSLEILRDASVRVM
jgi:hypothetical protein